MTLESETRSIQSEEQRATLKFSGPSCPKCTASFTSRLPDIDYVAKSGNEWISVTCWLCHFKFSVPTQSEIPTCDNCHRAMQNCGTHKTEMTESVLQIIEELAAEPDPNMPPVGSKHEATLWLCQPCNRRKITSVQLP